MDEAGDRAEEKRKRVEVVEQNMVEEAF